MVLLSCKYQCCFCQLSRPDLHPSCLCSLRMDHHILQGGPSVLRQNLVDFDLDVAMSACFCLSSCKFGRIYMACGQHNKIPKSKSTDHGLKPDGSLCSTEVEHFPVRPFGDRSLLPSLPISAHQALSQPNEPHLPEWSTR